VPEAARKKSNRSKITFERDTVALVESNVDDVTGEVLARTVERLMEEGALDATVISFLGKKGRMGQTIRVVCAKGSAEKFAEILVEETGTLGVKTTEWTRLIVPRKVLSVPVRIGNFRGSVSVKASKTGFGVRIKPELSEAKRISDSEKIPLRKVLEIISRTAESELT
jgi:pyridinium-3,5-bisthiocarboxylic acid mononucleotide nickel chelatase